MRFQPELSTYPHNSQRKKKHQKERKDYDYSFSLLNPEGTDHVLLTGDILTSYEHCLRPFPCRKCRKLMKCPLLLAIEMSPLTIGHDSLHRNLDIGRLYDAVLYDRYGEGYENPRSHFKGRFQANPLD